MSDTGIACASQRDPGRDPPGPNLWYDRTMQPSYTVNPHCGTDKGYRIHRKRGEATCEACRKARATYVQSRRDYYRNLSPEQKAILDAAKKVRAQRVAQATSEAATNIAASVGQALRNEAKQRAVQVLIEKYGSEYDQLWHTFLVRLVDEAADGSR